MTLEEFKKKVIELQRQKQEKKERYYSIHTEELPRDNFLGKALELMQLTHCCCNETHLIDRNFKERNKEFSDFSGPDLKESTIYYYVRSLPYYHEACSFWRSERLELAIKLGYRLLGDENDK